MDSQTCFFILLVKPYSTLTGTFTIKLLLLCPYSSPYDNKAGFDTSTVVIKICETFNMLLISSYILPIHCIISRQGMGEKGRHLLNNQYLTFVHDTE